MEKIKNKAIDTIEWIAALALTTVILGVLVVAPSLIELAIEAIL